MYFLNYMNVLIRWNTNLKYLVDALYGFYIWIHALNKIFVTYDH